MLYLLPKKNVNLAKAKNLYSSLLIKQYNGRKNANLESDFRLQGNY